MFITRKNYEELKQNNDNLKRLNLSLLQEKNELYKTNFEMAKELEQLKSKKTRKTTKKEDVVKKTNTRKPRTKKEDK